MTPLPSYTRPLRRDLLARRVIRACEHLALIAITTLMATILAHAALRTITALPILTDPAMVPGCC